MLPNTLSFTPIHQTRRLAVKTHIRWPPTRRSGRGYFAGDKQTRRREFRQLNNELDLVKISYLFNGNSFQNRGRMGRREQTKLFLVWREKRKTFTLFWQLCNGRADVYYYTGVLFSLAKWSNWMFLTGHKFSPKKYQIIYFFFERNQMISFLTWYTTSCLTLAYTYYF